MTGEACTRAAAAAAGARCAGEHPGEVLVLAHDGGDGDRWRVVASCLEHGRAVDVYKRRRETLTEGGLALWSNGRAHRFDRAAQLEDSR